ncbi:MAG: family 10 glycosylhydrolase [Armatimonadetes bacterium]|nr:family 10 glycosylhydrolase [Armatimonadota bacterium]
MLLASLVACIMSTSSTPPIDPPREFRGVWVATVDNIDWPSKKTLTTAQQQRELDAIIAKCDELKFNAIVFQVRPSGDSLYKSKLEPWSEYLTGQTGKAPNPAWDPLSYLCEKAHAKGIEVHAWFNPYRALHPAGKSKPSDDHITNTHPKSAPAYGRYRWMDPSDAYVQKHSQAVLLDVVKRYNVDGIHMDDYFYPYPEKDADGKAIPFPDSANFAKYQAGGGMRKLADWRRMHVDNFVQDVYKKIKAEKKWVKFGISPFGIWRPGFPKTTTAGIDQYDTLYADCKKWLNEGWCDYMTPQLYWPIAQTLQSYPVLLDWWVSENTQNRHLWPGNYSDQIRGKWEAQELIDQIVVTRTTPGAGGNVHFSMKIFMENKKDIGGLLQGGVYSQRAMVPATPWLGSNAPAAPKVGKISEDGRHLTINFRAPKALFVYLLDDSDHIIAVTSAESGQISCHLEEFGVKSYRLVSSSHTSVLSAATVVNLK